MRRMYKSATACVLAATLGAAGILSAQAPETTWRQIGNSLIDRSLAGLASGPVDRVWYSADGSQLMIRTYSGFVFSTSDFETWLPSSATPPAPVTRPGAATLPENGAFTRTGAPGSARFYSFARFVYKSDNNG